MSATGARELLTELYHAAVSGANVEALTASAVAALPLERRHRVWVFSIGKAAHVMAAAAVGELEKSLAEVAGGVIVGPEAAPSPTGTVQALTGDHPIPGARSFAAAGTLGQVIKRKNGADVGIVLLSGGASSLIAAPLPSMREAHLAELFTLLLASGLDIHRMNAVRKRFSRWAAGRMALALAPARGYCLAASDVTGDDLATIGSGPMVPDPTRVQEVIEVLRSRQLLGRIAPELRQYLGDCARGSIPETPKATHPAFAHVEARVVVNNRAALSGVAAAARRAGITAIVREQPLVGDAVDAGAKVVETLVAARERAERGSSQCIVWGGETTVTLPERPPPGGRCQELALSAARALADAGTRGDGVTVLAAGTDGRDGTTDAAGALVDGSTWDRIGSTRDPAKALRDHQSHEALAAAGALFSPGLTGTNVMDVVIGLVRA